MWELCCRGGFRDAKQLKSAGFSSEDEIAGPGTFCFGKQPIWRYQVKAMSHHTDDTWRVRVTLWATWHRLLVLCDVVSRSDTGGSDSCRWLRDKFPNPYSGQETPGWVRSPCANAQGCNCTPRSSPTEINSTSHAGEVLHIPVPRVGAGLVILPIPAGLLNEDVRAWSRG